MDKLFSRFLALLALHYPAQCHYMIKWTNHHRTSLMTLRELRKDFENGLLRIEPLSCNEAAVLWKDYSEYVSGRSALRDTSMMDNKQLLTYSLSLCDFADAKDGEAYQKICDSDITLLEGIKAMEAIIKS